MFITCVTRNEGGSGPFRYNIQHQYITNFVDHITFLVLSHVFLTFFSRLFSFINEEAEVTILMLDLRTKKWADDSDDEEAVGSVTESFEDGIKTITEIKTNAKGQKVKVLDI